MIRRSMPYDDAYITEFLTTEGASLDRYVLLEGDLLIGYRNEDGQLLVRLIDENDELALACRKFLERRGAPQVPRRSQRSG